MGNIIQGHSECTSDDASASSGCATSAPESSMKERIQSMKERRVDKKAEIEASKSCWSQLAEGDHDVGENPAADNLEVFQSLKKQWPSAGGQKFRLKPVGGVGVVHPKPFAQKSFWNWHHDDLVVDDECFAKGGQAEVFEAVGKDHDEELVLKVFRYEMPLRVLQRQWPHSMLVDESTRSSGYFSGGRYCNRILGAALTKAGRFAFIMAKCWGDLRKLIEIRMKHNNNQPPPFPNEVAITCMWQIAKGMLELHTRDIPHCDLKAANILIQQPSRFKVFDPIRADRFTCKLADFECSVGVVGTGFWRAPEILKAVKDRTVSTTDREALFTKNADVYSYAITCYEILTGGMPFKGVSQNNYDIVINGARPSLPPEIPPWMEALLNRCWDADPSKRPPSKEIVDILESNAGFQLDPTSVVIL
jgi:hypothetical protein